MSANKRFIFTMRPGVDARVEDYRRKHGLKSTSEALNTLIIMGLDRNERAYALADMTTGETQDDD